MSIDKKIEEIRNNENYVRFENIDKDFVNAIISVKEIIGFMNTMD